MIANASKKNMKRDMLCVYVICSVKEQKVTIAIMCIGPVGFAIIMPLYSHNLLPAVTSIISNPCVADACPYSTSNDKLGCQTEAGT